MPGEFRLVKLVVENRGLAELLREDRRDLRDEIPLFPREGEGDTEASGRHTGGIESGLNSVNR